MWLCRPQNQLPKEKLLSEWLKINNSTYVKADLKQLADNATSVEC